MWRHCKFLLTVPIDASVDPEEHMRKLLAPVFGDDWEVVLVEQEAV